MDALGNLPPAVEVHESNVLQPTAVQLTPSWKPFRNDAFNQVQLYCQNVQCFFRARYIIRG